MKHLSLCSGIGGLDLAAEWAGFETAAQCEIDEYASKVLAKNFPGVPNLHDIRTVTNERLAGFGISPAEITVISAGFPCQPYSLAGKGRGDRDERDLWGEVARVVGEIRPRWFVGENTPGLFARSNQRYFRRVLDDLAALGYSVGWGIWGACDVGAPHKRERVFILAYADGERRSIFSKDGREPCPPLDGAEAKTPFGTGGLSGKQRGGTDLSGDVSHAYGARRGADEAAEQRACKPLDQKGRRNESRGTDRISGNVPYTVCERGMDEPSDVDAAKGRQQAFGHIIGLHSAIPYAAGDELGVYGSAEEVEEIGSGRGDHGKRTQGNDGGQWWEAEPDVGRVADGIPNRVDRLRCLGNAVVPQQAYPIFRAIADYEKGERKNATSK